MRKSSYTITVLLFSAFIIALAIFTYREYLGPMLRNSKTTDKKIDLASDSLLHFRKPNTQGDIYSIEIDITGTSTNNLDIDIMKDGNVLHRARVKRGEVDFYYAADWYSDSMTLIFHRPLSTDGLLNVSTRFISLD